MRNKWCCNRERSVRESRIGGDLRGVLFVFASLAAASAWRCPAQAADAPGWMHALTSAPLPKHDEKTDAVLLYSEEILTVQPNGRTKEVDRMVYKILRPGGRSLGKVAFPFDSETRITHIHGWCIPSQGKDYEVKDKDVTEDGLIGMEPGELYSDHRVKVMQIPAADPGNIIGYEVEHEDRPYVLQDDWVFQAEMPVADARYTLQLPPGWEYKAVWVNHPEVAPGATGANQWQWELKDIPEIKAEEAMPPWRGVAGVMLVALIPPGGAAHGFLTWDEMGAWQKGLVQGRMEASPEIKAKVAELTAHQSSPVGKMTVLAGFMQDNIRYVGIELGIGGWQPHNAAEVFSHRYGDCKDKVTLLLTMLKEVGIDSYYLVIDTERGNVTPAIPPHMGLFDHVILAIRLPDGVSDARFHAIIDHSKLGKLLIFDPTDELTPLGSIRGELQANYGLLVTPNGGELIKTPQQNSATSAIERTAKLTLDAQGGLKGDVHESRIGDPALLQRERLRTIEKASDRLKPMETVMSQSMGSFAITKASISNMKETALPLEYDWSFQAREYAKTAGNLLLVRPRVVGVKAWGILENKEPRKYPIEFRGPQHDRDVFDIILPDGYEVDELPPPVDVEYSFGSYHSKTVVQGNALHYTRTYEINELSLPLSQAEDLKKFYRIIASDERNTAVLKPAH